jgi:hypothetical protein
MAADTNQTDIYNQILELKAKENARILTHRTLENNQTINTAAQGPISTYIKKGKDDGGRDCYLMPFFIDVPGKVGALYVKPVKTKK